MNLLLCAVMGAIGVFIGYLTLGLQPAPRSPELLATDSSDLEMQAVRRLARRQAECDAVLWVERLIAADAYKVACANSSGRRFNFEFAVSSGTPARDDR